MTDHDSDRPHSLHRSDDDVHTDEPIAEPQSSGTGDGTGRASPASTDSSAGSLTADTPTDTTTIRPSDLFDALAHRDRRAVLSALCVTEDALDVETIAVELVDHTGPVSPAAFDGSLTDDAATSTPEPTVSAGARRSATVALVHNHLPRLAAAGLVRFDRDQAVVRRTATFRRTEPALETLLETGAAVDLHSERSSGGR